MPNATATIGTIPRMTVYQPGALPITGDERAEIVSSGNATSAATFQIVITDYIGKAPSVMTSANPAGNDRIAFYQHDTGLPKAADIGNLGVPFGNLPTGGNTSQILSKASGTNYDATWVDLSSLVTASTSLFLTGTATITLGVATNGIGALQLASGAVVATSIATAAVDLSSAQITGTLPMTYGGVGTTTLTSFGVLYGAGTSTIGVTSAGAANLVLTGNNVTTAPSFQQVNLTLSVTGVLGVPSGGTGTASLVPAGVLYGANATTLGLTAAGGTALPLTASGTTTAPSFAVLTVPGGGTGTTTLAANGVPYGAGAGAVGIAAAGATGTFLSWQGGTAAAPSATTALTNLALGTGLSGGPITTTGTVSFVGNLGQCQLNRVNATNVALTPMNGNLIKINGGVYEIPAAGVTATITTCFLNGVAGTSLASSTLYYAYLFAQNASTLQIDFSTTSSAVSTTAGNIGMKIKTGDNTRTLIGMAYPQTGPVFTDTQANRLVRSYFNSRRMDILGTNFGGVTNFTSTSYTEVNSPNSRVQIIMWANEMAQVQCYCTVANVTQNQDVYIAVGVNSTTAASGNEGRYTQAVANLRTAFACSYAASSNTEGLNTFYPLSKVSAGTASFFNNGADPALNGFVGGPNQ